MFYENTIVLSFLLSLLTIFSPLQKKHNRDMNVTRLTQRQFINQYKSLIQVPSRKMTSLPQNILEELKQFPSVITLPIQWGQQDAWNHLNNVDWLRFIESGRIDYMYLLSLSMDQKEAAATLNGSGPGIIVKSQSCTYKVPVTYPDSLTIATKIEDLTKDRFTFYTKVYSNRLAKLASESRVVSVSYDHSKNAKSNFTENMLAAIKRMETNPTMIQKEATELPLRKFITS